MASLPPKIDQRTYEEIVRQIEALAEDFTNEGTIGWKPPGAIEVEPKPELLSGLILNENIPITVEATVAKLTGRILNEDIDLGNNNIIKKGTFLNDDQTQKIVQIKKNTPVEVVLYARNTLIDATLAQKISQIDGLKQVKVKVTPPSAIEVERKYWIDRILAKDIDNDIKSGTVIDEAIAQKIEDQGISKVKVKVETDAGQALIKIFARMVKSVSDRLNRVPEKNFLAFLDLIGGKLNPPLSAKVPLTFYLAEGSPTDGLVPIYTQVSAPPAEGSEEEIVFETDHELVVTTAQLQAVFVREPSQDKYSDRTLVATGQKDEAFLAFSGDRPIPHSLYITCPEIFALPTLTGLELIFTTDSAESASLFQDLSLDWSYWNGSQWQKISPPPSKSKTGKKFTLTFTNLPIPTTTEIVGKTEKWLQAKLTNINSNISANLLQIKNIQGSITIAKSDLIPEVCLFNNTPLDLSKDFYPFGEQPELNDTFYIALHDTFIKPDAKVSIDVVLSHKPVNTNELIITWEFGNGKIWHQIDNNNNEVRWIESSQAIQFTESNNIQAKLQFPEQKHMPSISTVNGEAHYWIRARITEGHFGKAERERKYPAFEGSAVLAKPVKKDNKEIEVDNLDLFQKGDTIRLIPNTQGFPEEHKISTITSADRKLVLETPIINNTLAVGTRIQRKLIISEIIPKTYDPPLVKSLKLTYDFTLTEDATYCADNDFNYSEQEDFTTKLKQKAANKDKLLNLESVKGLTIGEFLTINSENYQIETIKTDTNQVVLTSAISQDYAKNTTVNRYFRPFITTIDKDPTLYLGFDRSFGNKTVTLYAQVEPPLPNELANDLPSTTVKAKLVWEYSSPLGWETLGVQDETQAFSQRGLIQFIAPADFSKRETFGKELYWLRVRWQDGKFRVKPRLRRWLTNTIWAIQATTLTEEVLGSSNSDPNQVFVTNNAPILMGQKLEVQEGQNPPELESDRVKEIRDNLGEIESVWVLWQEVTDFYASKASDHHYLLDRQTGEIRFGDGQAGMIPPRGRNNIRLSFYRTGGGETGNVADETITQLNTTIPYIDRVINLEAAAGGAEQEDLERLKQRVPKKIRHRDRAVTIDDLADLAYAASTDVARVKVVPTEDLIAADFSALNLDFWLDPSNPKISLDDLDNNLKNKWTEINRNVGKVKLIILPNSKDRQPVTSTALLKRVETYIRDRCQPTMDLVVTAPKWQEVTVTVTITPKSFDNADILRKNVQNRLEDFLHPLTGGKDNEGWQFGRYPEKSDFYAIIQSISGVDHVISLKVEKAELSADTVIYSGNHVVNLSQ